MEKKFDVRGKTVLVTGASSGIGKEAAAALAGKGAKVILAVRNIAAGQEAADMIRQRHPGAAVEVGPPLEMGQPSSIRAFARHYTSAKRPLHVLVNNAGANYLSERLTEEGVPLLTQVNYLGPYMLTRLLEPSLVASAPSRVVNVSSVTHRYGVISNAASFLSRSADGVGAQYPATKLGNVLFTYELQRRLGHLGVQACAVDPGSVSTNIYKESRLFSRQPLRWLIQNLYAPPWDGASAVVHAASAPSWHCPSSRNRSRRDKGPLLQKPTTDTTFFARGIFAWPTITGFRGQEPGFLGGLRLQGWALRALTLSAVDWPLRRLASGRLLAKTVAVPSAPISYDEDLARALWDLSADKCKLPREPSLSLGARQ